MDTDKSDENGIIYAFKLDGKGGATHLQGEEISKELKGKSLTWVHLDRTNPGAREWLEREITYLDQIIIDALLAEETRPRILEFDQGAMLILRGVNLNDNAEPEDMVSIRLWIDKHRIISIRRRKLRAVNDIRTSLEENRGPKNAGDFLVTLTNRLFERMEPSMTALYEKMDDLETKILDDPDISERQGIIDLREEAMTYRRYMAPQRDVMVHLRTSDINFMDDMHKRRTQEALDRVMRYIEDLDMIRERAQIVKDELTNALSDRLNRNMYVLSVIAAIFLPLGFLTGLLGINVGGIPGADNGDAFYIFCGILVTLVALQVIIFKKLKWF
ncbi:MAG: zinc transporter ZntB [Rhodospirillales bacterium]|nr:zinc transporter ZntB [Rhodospirillales bacterium]MCB9995351.1 zinc transporter ZntB [Rhodospirillales bacterium]